jgi:hypothetical protein
VGDILSSFPSLKEQARSAPPPRLPPLNIVLIFYCATVLALIEESRTKGASQAVVDSMSA